MEDKNPISPHIQIYNWHISSLVSISHRITGIINFFAITLIGLWIASLLLGEGYYEHTSSFLSSFFGKFICIGIVWSFTFQVLSEIRHLIMDLGYGFEPKTTKISGLIVLIGSFPISASIYDKSYNEVLTFISSQPSKLLFSMFLIFAYFFSALSISEVFEDYIEDKNIKNAANKTLNIFAIVFPLLIIILVFNL